ncbi:MAG: CRISPR-associated protein Cas4 [Bacteroidota bacterium]
MYAEDDFIQLSALQHYVFCPRQCGLIHVEGIWSENVYTARGEILHEKVDTDTYETRGTVKTVRGLRIHSFRLGITGRADVVEFFKSSDSAGHLEVVPVEFKAGQPKEDASDKVQLCAQAMCLEEMLRTTVRKGEFFYGRIRRRVEVILDESLRRKTEEVIAEVHSLVSGGRAPAARYSEKCGRCSLEEICKPKAMNERRLHAYMNSLYQP